MSLLCGDPSSAIVGTFHLEPLLWLESAFAHRYRISRRIANGRVTLPFLEVSPSTTSSDIASIIFGNSKIGIFGAKIMATTGARCEERTRKWSHPGASWRQIKLFRDYEPGRIIIEQSFRIQPYRDRDRVPGQYKVEYIIDDTWTLGEPWECYTDSCIKDRSEHETLMLRQQGGKGLI
ncbi:hypothetical protein CLAFUW4_06864 [Fulvia fulva]|uniref:Uncharacterized protein n=1 Tax=Passalora fulva TaxID=5499 RepID=A0A9Q8LKN6_PASFU|nr:uncharacterized protein CLAFUR5_07002 [Fulvia fulva]KAK4621377.1 hypothetical protein CLAFUR4_06872 [Fulvia fulva]KAK4622894.1 hypothetical protein CLAFUR0_06869 [Fulvia fulva]UJO18518.1 hypothetical protein CLAFUR5_07002 [Fulvia fulva]WPV15677.1 hypothetical protein CLAFUW4_06864 [Fulvia fulva]WPV31450.1 hypothetical protein CLAFUW7_06863 [Fulvia fulva]